MKELKLVLPEEITKEQFGGFKQEFIDHHITEGIGSMLEQDF